MEKIPMQPSTEGGRELIRIALAREPRLTRCGVGCGSRKYGGTHTCGPLRPDSDDDADQVAASAAWISRQRRTKTPRLGSYGAKHVVERWWSVESGSQKYVSNGAFLAAAIGLGLAVAPTNPPNMIVSLRRDSVHDNGGERNR